MTIDEIADYCEFKGCTVALGDPDVGFIHVDGRGLRRSNNYGRLLAMHELGAVASPSAVLEAASVFKVRRGEDVQALTRDAFEIDHRKFVDLVNG